MFLVPVEPDWSLFIEVLASPKQKDEKRTHKCIKEQKDTYMAVVEKYTLDGAKTLTLMKHK